MRPLALLVLAACACGDSSRPSGPGAPTVSTGLDAATVADAPTGADSSAGAIAAMGPPIQFRVVRPADRPLVIAHAISDLVALDELFAMGGDRVKDDARRVHESVKQALAEIEVIAPGVRARAAGDVRQLAEYRALAAGLTAEQVEGIQARMLQHEERLRAVDGGRPREPTAISRSDEQGDTARVWIRGPSGRELATAIPLVREGGRWFIDIPDLLEGILSKRRERDARPKPAPP
jgi:hypothetical protein